MNVLLAGIHGKLHQSLKRGPNTMQIEYFTALLAGGCAIAGSAITGWFTYSATASQNKSQRYKRELRRTYKDIAAFHRLEERYTQALASDTKSSESWKRDIRRSLRADGFDSPSDGATANGAMARITEIE